MIERLGPLILLCTLTVGQPRGDDQIPVTVVKPGDNFTMTCVVDRTDAGLVYWYRMRFETTIQTIAEGSYETITLHGNFNNHRFRIKTVTKNQYSLSIFNVTKEDEASYFCQAGSSYKMSFLNTTFLMVLDQRNHAFYVDQISSATTPLGGSVQLNCSLLSKDSSVLCPSKRSVHWFRSGSEESPASTIYTYQHQTDEQNQRKCVHSLTVPLQHLNDTGMYYCAVATCGEILFGNGTRVDISSDSSGLKSVCVMLGILLLCSAVINAVMLYRYRKATYYRGVITTNNSTEVLDRIEDQSNAVGNNVAGVNYVMLDFPLRKGKRKNIKNGLPPECFYSTTRDY